VNNKAHTNLGVVEVQVLYFEVNADSRNEGRREAIVSISHQEARFADSRIPEHQKFDMNVMGLLTLAPFGMFHFHAIVCAFRWIRSPKEGCWLAGYMPCRIEIRIEIWAVGFLKQTIPVNLPFLLAAVADRKPGLCGTTSATKESAALVQRGIDRKDAKWWVELRGEDTRGADLGERGGGGYFAEFL